MPEITDEHSAEDEIVVEELPQLIVLEGSEDAPACENGVCL